MSESTSALPKPTMTLTSLRKTTAPFLPPPLLRLIHAVDTYAYLHRASITASTGIGNTVDEASMTLLTSILAAYLIYRFVKGMAILFSGKRSTAHLEEGVLKSLVGDGSGGYNNNNGVKFDKTVLFVGAMGSGKTCLLHRLCNMHTLNWEMPMTVTSTVVNAAYLNSNNKGVVRIIDYPGHTSLSSQLTQLLLYPNTNRVVFTIDTSQPVTDAVSLLYTSILIHPQVRKSWNNKQLSILITCTKTDVRGSKNYKRIKIQIRNELERLRKVDCVVGDSNDGDFSLKGKTIDLDHLGEDVPYKLYFVEVGLGKEGLEVVRDFVLNGAVPNYDKK